MNESNNENIASNINELTYQIDSFMPVINSNINELTYQIKHFLGTINGNVASLELDIVGNSSLGDWQANLKTNNQVLDNMCTILSDINGAMSILTSLGIVAILAGKGSSLSDIIKNIKGIPENIKKFFKNKTEEETDGELNGDNDRKNITVNCECHCDCCCGDGGGEPGGEPVDEGATETEGKKVAILDQYGNEIKNLDSSVIETSDDVIALGNNFTTATEEVNSTASVVFPKISSVINTSLIPSLVLVAAQALKTEKITNGAFDGIASAAKLSNGSLLADATSTYGKWLMDIKTFFEKRLGLYSKNEKAINGTVSNEGKVLNKLNQENLLKYNGTTSTALAKDIAIYNQLGTIIKKIVLENGKKINAAHGAALKGYSKTTSTELAADYAAYKKIGNEILKLLGTNGKTANANNKSALGQLNKQTAEALNQEIALYKKIEKQLNQMQKKSSKTVNTTHNQGLISYLGDTKAHLEQEMHQWDTHGRHVIGTNKQIITSITGIHASGLLKYVGELINPLATIERLWNTHGQHVTSSNKNTMNSINSNTSTGLSTLEGAVNSNGQSIEGIVSRTGNKSTKAIAGTVNTINQSLKNAGPAWYSSIKSSLGEVLNDIDSFVTRAEGKFKRFESWLGGIKTDFENYIANFNSSSMTPALSTPTWESSGITGGELSGMDIDAFAFAAEPIKFTWDTSRLNGSNLNSSGFALDRSGDVNVVINSPKALNPFEVRRQMEKMSRNMANGFY